MQAPQSSELIWHGTTILTVRKAGKVVIGGDGQVSIGQTVIKSNAKKVRKLGKGDVIGGFAGATADAFTLFERLESKLEQYPGQLTRAAVELAKDWRTDRYLRRLEAMMIVADRDVSLVLTGTGDVLEPEGGVMAIGSGGNYALAAARVSCPGYCSSLDSRRSNSVKASAVAPAKPPITSPLPSLRTFLALDLMTVWPMDTCPSPPITTLPALRTVRMVVPCQVSS